MPTRRYARKRVDRDPSVLVDSRYLLWAALQPMFNRIDHYPLSADVAVWGKTVTDERYAVITHDAVAH